MHLRLLVAKVMVSLALVFVPFSLPAETPPGSAADVQKLLASYVIKESQTPVRERAGWHRPRRVAIFVPRHVTTLKPDYEEWFQAVAAGAELVFATNIQDLAAAASDADVVFGSCAVVNEDMAKLRWMQRYGVGVEDCLSNVVLKNPEILLTNTRGLSGPYIAEHVIAMTMMLSHGLHQYYATQLKGEWLRSLEYPASVQAIGGKEMLVVGLGGIGTKVAEKAAALGMRVKAIRNSSREGPDFVDYVGLSSELLPLSANADFVVNTLPLTRQTTGIFDKAFFSTMKSGAYFINVGRGKSVVTDDLVSALNDGAIAGAGLDVFDPEPLPASHALWKMPNVLITPHTSGRSGYGSLDSLIFVRENLRRYAAGAAMLNVVDRSLEY